MAPRLPIAVELEKAGGLLGKPVEGMSAAERWAAFFRYAGDSGRRELVNGLMKAEEGIAMAGEMLLTVSQDEIEQARREAALKVELDWQSSMAEARKKGEAKGLARGWQEGKAEGRAEARQEKLQSARRLKEDGFAPEQIQWYTGLSPEDIAAL